MATTKINEIHVNERLSSVFRDILYHDMSWLPEETFTEKFSEGPNQGILYINKLDKDTVAPKKPGSDFEDTEGSTDQVALYINNSFEKSTNIRDITMTQLAENDQLQAEIFDKVLLETREGYNTSFTAKVTDEAEDHEDYDEITKDNVKEKVLDMRQKLRERKVRPTFMKVSTSVYSAMLAFSGEEFIPNYNEETFANGLVGRFLGLRVYEETALAESEAKYVDESGDDQSVDLTKVDIIMGRPDDIASVVSLNQSRLAYTDDFFGLKAQTQTVSGFKVLDSDRVLVKYNEDPTA